MNIKKIKKFILHKIESEISPTFSYHNLNHTIYVLQECNHYIRRLKVNKEEAFLLRTAALLHDTGFLWTFNNHEERSIEYAKELLPEWGYTSPQITVICDLILATRIPQKPKNKLEQIICDADLNYLGTNNYYPVAETLFQEFMYYKVIKSDTEWHNLQISFLKSHTYHTDYAQKHREPIKQNYLRELMLIG